MSREDQIFFSSLGAALMVFVIAFVLMQYATSETAAQWTQSLLTAGAIAVAIFVPIATEGRRRIERQRVAAMEIAAQLRAWMRLAADFVSGNLLYEESDGHEGTWSIDCPAFPFSGSLDRVSQMSPSDAANIFNLIEARERAQGEITGALTFGDGDDALRALYSKIPKLFFQTRNIYIALALEVGLPERTNQKWELDAMKQAAHRYE